MDIDSDTAIKALKWPQKWIEREKKMVVRKWREVIVGQSDDNFVLDTGRILPSTHYSWDEFIGETNSQISMVDPSGYISPKERIENLIRAGERLDQYRREHYDYADDSEDDGEWMDPLREKNLDYVDAHRIRQESLRRLSSQAARKRAESERPSSPDSATSVAEEAVREASAEQGSAE